MGHRLVASAAAAALALGLGACADAPTAPAPSRPDLAAVKFWEAGAAVTWNARADQLVLAQPMNAYRLFACLSLAQLRAAEAAEAAGGAHPPVSAAIGGASAAMLNFYFAGQTAANEAFLDAQESADPWPGAQHTDFAAGEATGRSIAAQVIAFCQTDGLGLTNPLTTPPYTQQTGPGNWVYNGGPISFAFLGARPFYMTSGDQLRPLPPPAFGSAEFNAGLAEVRAVADSRTAEQTAIANYWNANQNPNSIAANNALARELITRYRQRDAVAARTLFLMHSAAWDALVGCWDAKFYYWLIRPAQADAGIVTVFPTPPHPSYPSGHACASGGLTGVLAAIFPQERARLEAVAVEASLSRLYAGIHYRFDADAGLALGRAAAALALAANLNNVAPLQ